MTDQRTVATPAAALPIAPGTGSRLLAVALLVVAAVGIGRVLLKLGGIVVLGGIVLATVGALAGGILLLHAMVGH
ncbi:MAG: hypothetical protein ACTHJL_12085 [Amnibacterium sp.]